MLDGACEIGKLVDRVKELDMPAVAMTDHGNIFSGGVCQRRERQGREAYPGLRVVYLQEGRPPGGAQGRHSYNHLIVLAENDEGYRNLVKVVSEVRARFYYKPRVSKKFLEEHSRG